AGVGAGGDSLHGQADVADRLELVEDGVRRSRVPGSDRGAGCARAAAHTPARSCPLDRPWARPPKSFLRILVNACVPNVGGVPSYELRTQSYTSGRDGTGHDRSR